MAVLNLGNVLPTKKGSRTWKHAILAIFPLAMIDTRGPGGGTSHPVLFLCHILLWTASWQNQQYGICTQRRLRSAWASAQSDQSSLCAHLLAKDPSFLHAHSEDSDQTGRMPKLIWVFAGRTCHFCWFCYEAALIILCHRRLHYCCQCKRYQPWFF